MPRRKRAPILAAAESTAASLFAKKTTQFLIATSLPGARFPWAQAMLHGDELRMRQVLGNLLDNADALTPASMAPPTY